MRLPGPAPRATPSPVVPRSSPPAKAVLDTSPGCRRCAPACGSPATTWASCPCRTRCSRPSPSWRALRAQAIQERTAAFYEEQVRPLVPPRRPARARGAPRGREIGWCCSRPPRATCPSWSRGSCAWTRCSATASRWMPRGCTPGRPLGEVCFGDGQAHPRGGLRARRRASPLSACAFYTDSYSDLPVLEVVGRPVAVHPDHRLRREALRRGWPVVDWGVPSGGPPAAGSPRSLQSGRGARRRAERRSVPRQLQLDVEHVVHRDRLALIEDGLVDARLQRLDAPPAPCAAPA